MGRNYLVAAVVVGILFAGCGRDDSNKTGNDYGDRPVVQEQEQEQVFAPEGMDKISQIAGPGLEDDQFAAALQEEEAAVKEEPASVVKAEEKVKSAMDEEDAPLELVIENEKGAITLPHRMHAKTFGCLVCHGPGKPEHLDLGKVKAHALCKGCHKEKEKGPTNCNGCHAKKAVVDEGC